MSTEAPKPSAPSDRSSGARIELRALQVTAAAIVPLAALLPLSKFPSICIFFFITGFPCPGCGFTRALQQNFWLNLPQALKLHPFALPGVIWLGLLLLSIVVRPLADLYVERIRLVHRIYLAGTLAILVFGIVRIITILTLGGASWMAPELLGR